MSDSLYVRIRPDSARASTTRRVSPYGEATMSKGPIYEVHPQHAHEFRASPQMFEIVSVGTPPAGGKVVPYMRPPVRQNMPKPPPPAAPPATPTTTTAPTDEGEPAPPTPPKPTGKKARGKKEGDTE